MSILDSLHRYRFSWLPPLSQVPRVVNQPTDVFRRYFVAQAAPVVFTGSPLFSGQPRTLDDLVRRDGGKLHVDVRSDYLNVRTRRFERMALSEYVERYIRPWERDGCDAFFDMLQSSTLPISHYFILCSTCPSKSDSGNIDPFAACSVGCFSW